MAPWSLLSKVLGAKEVESEDVSPVPAPSPVQAVVTNPAPAPAPPVVEDAGRAFGARGPLDEAGQQSEQVRERINNLSLRLDDLKTLSEDFGHIIRPLSDVVTQNIQIQAKLLESEALLVRERDALAATRAELNELHVNATRTAGELASATADLRAHQAQLHDQDAQITQMRLRIDDQSGTIESIERQIAAETERARALSDDNQTLRAEVETLEQLRTRSESDLSEAREQNAISNAENTRLQQLAESLSHRLSGLKGQIMELEPQIHAGRQDLAIMQTKLSTEQLARQKSEVTREAERTAQEAEIASLTMKIEGLAAHVGTTEKIVANLRDQYREKAEALRLTEKNLKEAVADRIVNERRLEQAQEAAARHLAQTAETQRVYAELKERSDLLARTLSAKETQIEGGARKIASLTSRVDQMSARFEQERAGFEAANRRLIEELQSEKAERSLAQGALDIARNSRSKLLTQYTALKRQQTLGGLRPLELGPDDEVTPRPETGDNVRVLKTSDKTD